MLINLRNALMAGKRTPTAKDYVQNGLVAMWDGIENAGWGTHNASATAWKDLVGGGLSTGASLDFSHKTAYHASFNYTYLTLSTVAANAIKSSDCTVEVVFWGGPTTTTGSLVVLQTYPATSYFDARLYYYDNGAGSSANSVRRWTSLYGNRQRDGLWSTRTKGTFTFGDPVYAAFGFAKLGTAVNPCSWGEVGNSLVATAQTGDVESLSFSYAKCNYCAIRVYSRALTTNEIAANYAIDKERFNLP